MSAANTKDCIRDLIEKRVVGVLFDALPLSPSLALGTKTLLFDDGTGFTFNSRGAFWSETAIDISKAVKKKQDELHLVEKDIKDVLNVAGLGTRE